MATADKAIEEYDCFRKECDEEKTTDSGGNDGVIDEMAVDG